METTNSKKGAIIGLIVLIAAIVGIVALTQAEPEPIQQAENIQVQETAEQVELVAGEYEIDNANSELRWQANKLGGGHDGTVEIQSGQVVISNNQVESGQIVIDMTTIVTDDNGAGSPAVDEHLASSDFFLVSEYPTATLTTTSITPAGGDTYDVVADLEVRGTTNTISFPATITTTNNLIMVMADVQVDREAYDVGTASSLADIALEDTFTLSVNLVGNLNSEGQLEVDAEADTENL